MPREQLIFFHLVAEDDFICFQLPIMLEEVRCLHGHHAALHSILAVQICLRHAISADEPTQLVHLAVFHLVGV